MNKILAVVGSTASGKTAFALQLALQALQPPHNYSGVDLISVDSRQVYKGLEILTGADVPEDFIAVTTEENLIANRSFEFPYYKHKNFEIALHGVSIITADQDWSVVHFKNFASKIILQSLKENRLPILVGGTGLYQQQLFNSDAHLHIPPNNDVRRKAATLTLAELSEWLFAVDPEALVQMNHSDIANPRRLVRAIEKAVNEKKYYGSSFLIEEAKHTQLPECELVVLGMQLSLKKIQEKISERVSQRFDQGAITEVKELERLCKTIETQACLTLGVTEITQFLSGTITREECEKIWALHEFQYAKRQLTWFKKQKEIVWLDEIQKKQYTLST